MVRCPRPRWATYEIHSNVVQNRRPNTAFFLSNYKGVWGTWSQEEKDHFHIRTGVQHPWSVLRHLVGFVLTHLQTVVPCTGHNKKSGALWALWLACRHFITWLGNIISAMSVKFASCFYAVVCPSKENPPQADSVHRQPWNKTETTTPFDFDQT